MPRLHPGGEAFDELKAVGDRIGWPRRPLRTAGAARALYLHAPLGTPLWVARDTIEPLTIAARRMLSGGSLLLAAEPDEPYEP